MINLVLFNKDHTIFVFLVTLLTAYYPYSIHKNWKTTIKKRFFAKSLLTLINDITLTTFVVLLFRAMRNEINENKIGD